MSDSLATLCMVYSHQAPLSMGFPRQEYLSVLQFPSPRHLPDPGIKPMSSALAGVLWTTEPPEKPPVCFPRAKPKVNLITQINKAELASHVIGPTFG